MLRFVTSTLNTGTKVFLLQRRLPLLHMMVAFARPIFLFNNKKLTVLQATSVGEHFQICNYFLCVKSEKRLGVIIWIVHIWGIICTWILALCVICCIAFRKLFYLTAFLLACNNGCHTCRGAASYGLICLYKFGIWIRTSPRINNHHCATRTHTSPEAWLPFSSSSLVIASRKVVLVSYSDTGFLGPAGGLFSQEVSRAVWALSKTRADRSTTLPATVSCAAAREP